jgi:hypothetical protein
MNAVSRPRKLAAPRSTPDDRRRRAERFASLAPADAAERAHAAYLAGPVGAAT